LVCFDTLTPKKQISFSRFQKKPENRVSHKNDENVLQKIVKKDDFNTNNSVWANDENYKISMMFIRIRH